MVRSNLIKAISLFLFLTISSSLFSQAPCLSDNDGDYQDLNSVNTTDNSCYNSPYYLLFNDEFTDENYSNSIWNRADGPGRSSNTYYTTYFDPSNIEISNSLKLNIKEETVFKSGRYFYYTGSEMMSKYRYKYGKFEIRCKTPVGDGLVPAFWLYGQKSLSQSSYEWNEIDVFEFFNKNNTGNSKQSITVHFGPEGNGATHRACGINYNPLSIIDFTNNWHTYSVEWTPYQMVFFTDGNLSRADYKYFYVDNASTAFHPVNCGMNLTVGQNGIVRIVESKVFPTEPMAIIVTLDGWEGVDKRFRNDQLLSNCSTLPTFMEVDYVSCYTTRPCESNRVIEQENLHINSYTSNVGADFDYDIEFADNIETNGNVFINRNAKVEFVASNVISLKPGFRATMLGYDQYSSHPEVGFNARISNDYNCNNNRMSHSQNYNTNVKDVSNNLTKISESKNNSITVENLLIANKNNFQIYPSLFSDLLVVTSENSQFPLHFEICNNLGQIMKTEKLYSQYQTILVDYFIEGFYFATIKDKNGSIIKTQKLVKKTSN